MKLGHGACRNLGIVSQSFQSPSETESDPPWMILGRDRTLLLPGQATLYIAEHDLYVTQRSDITPRDGRI